MISANTPTLGPCSIGTLAHKEASSLVRAYCGFLDCQVLEQRRVSEQEAALWQTPATAGMRCWLLGNSLGRAWLRVVEEQEAVSARPTQQPGWMAMEVLVQDVDALASSLIGSPFEILRPPADLALSENIRATQVLGPAGELLYLTQIKGDVPPFDLPRARCAVDHLFIPVLCTADRNASLALYESLAQTKGLSFDTKVTVINHLRDYPTEQQHPLATVQLAERSLIEIDQLEKLSPPPEPNGQLPGGIAMVTFSVDQLPADQTHYRLTNAPYNNARACVVTGTAGELVELIERGSADSQ